MIFTKILEKLIGEYVILGLIDLTDIGGILQSIADEERIVLQIEHEIETVPIDFVKYVMIINPDD